LWGAGNGGILTVSKTQGDARLPLKPETLATIYAGVNYVFAPAPGLDDERFLKFQGALAADGLSFSQTNRTDGEWTLIRAKPQLQVQMKLPSQPVLLGQIMVTSESVDQLPTFSHDASGVYDAFFQVWPGEKQVIMCDATVRHLYDAGGVQAFQYLWEERLGQQLGQLSFLGKQVSGGGLRLVMPPEPTDAEPVQTEVRVESFFTDPRKLFVQATMVWPQPQAQASGGFDPARLIRNVEEFANGDLLDFLTLKGGAK
jgi:hypothetical protein